MNIDAYILIGGRSSRLGIDKAQVEFEGETLADRSARVIESALSPKSITFVARDRNQLRAELGHRVIFDLRPGSGAWSGLHAALVDAQSEWAFVLACDMPFVTTELLCLFAGFLSDDFYAVIPCQPDERLQPLCAFYRKDPTLTLIETLFNADASLPPLNTIADQLRSRIVPPHEYSSVVNADRLFLNINTKPDLAAAQDLCESSVASVPPW